MTFYLIGIKGSAMAGLAKILLDYDYEVLGCDYEEHFFTEDDLNVQIENFSNMQLKREYYYIIGNAFLNHSVTNYIQHMGYTYDYYPHFVATFFSKQLVCVAGTHGKTTTTSLIATLNPGVNYLIGDGSGFGNKENKWFLLESCEYKDTFLNYKPKIALILNIEFDHPDYYVDLEAVKSSFLLFSRKAELIVLNGDDPNTKEIEGNCIRYGRNKDNDIIFEVKGKTVCLCDEEYELPYYGIHYAYDFVGAYIVSKLMNTKSEDIFLRLKEWKLPKRRREFIELRHQIVVCDYAHHPTEIKALYETLHMEYPKHKLIIIYEPHTYSRTLSLMEEYITSLNLFDSCYIYEIFPSAREMYNVELEKKIYKEFLFERFKSYQFMKFREMENIVLCFVGAGKIDKLYQKYLLEWEKYKR